MKIDHFLDCQAREDSISGGSKKILIINKTGFQHIKLFFGIFQKKS